MDRSPESMECDVEEKGGSPADLSTEVSASGVGQGAHVSQEQSLRTVRADSQLSRAAWGKGANLSRKMVAKDIGNEAIVTQKAFDSPCGGRNTRPHASNSRRTSCYQSRPSRETVKSNQVTNEDGFPCHQPGKSGFVLYIFMSLTQEIDFENR